MLLLLMMTDTSGRDKSRGDSEIRPKINKKPQFFSKVRNSNNKTIIYMPITKKMTIFYTTIFDEGKLICGYMSETVIKIRKSKADLLFKSKLQYTT